MTITSIGVSAPWGADRARQSCADVWANTWPSPEHLTLANFYPTMSESWWHALTCHRFPLSWFPCMRNCSVLICCLIYCYHMTLGISYFFIVFVPRLVIGLMYKPDSHYMMTPPNLSYLVVTQAKVGEMDVQKWLNIFTYFDPVVDNITMTFAYIHIIRVNIKTGSPFSMVNWVTTHIAGHCGWSVSKYPTGGIFCYSFLVQSHLLDHSLLLSWFSHTLPAFHFNGAYPT